MSKRALLTITAGMGILAIGTPAQAAPPEPQTYSLTLPSQEQEGANGFCEMFPVLVEVEIFQEIRGGGKLTGRGTASLTNTQTGESITLNVSGPGTVTLTPDGGFSIDAAGPNLFFTTAGNSFPGVPTVNYTTGHLQFTVDAAGKTTSYQLHGRSTDMCAALS